MLLLLSINKGTRKKQLTQQPQIELDDKHTDTRGQDCERRLSASWVALDFRWSTTYW